MTMKGEHIDFRVNAADEVLVRGLAFSGPVIVMRRTEGHLVFRITGATAWGGRGRRTYYTTEYWLLQRQPDSIYGYERATIVEAREPGVQWRKCLAGFDALIAEREKVHAQG